MFDDVLTSSKGPGIIGTLLAILVLGGFGGLGMMSISSGPVGPTADAQIAEQKDRMIDLEKAIKDESKDRDLYKGYQKELPNISLQAKLLDMRAHRVADLKKKLRTEQDGLNSMGQAFEDYKSLYRKNERGLAVGEIHDLSATKGARYKKAKVLRVDAMGMRVSISSGPKGIKYDELPEDLQDRFQFHNDESEAYQVALSVAQAKMDEKAAKWNKEKQSLEAAAKASAKVNSISQKRRQITVLQERIRKKVNASVAWGAKADRYDRKAREARKRGAISIDGGNARKARATAKSLKRAAEKGRREVRKLKAEIVELQRSLKK